MMQEIDYLLSANILGQNCCFPILSRKSQIQPSSKQIIIEENKN